MQTVPKKPGTFDFSPRTRLLNLQRMQEEVFDILVIGGGITGAGIARDAVLRGFKTALIEKDDFASGTSSKSSKLIHGGFRYLSQYYFGLVHEALMERKTLMDLAPHLVHPLHCLLPLYKGSVTSPLTIDIGLWLYDLLALNRNIGRHRMVKPEELIRMESGYRRKDLLKAAEYYDCKADDFRLVMATVQSAAGHGAVIANYVKAVDFGDGENGHATVLAGDRIDGENIPIRARVIANASGPWSDRVHQTLLKHSDGRLRLTKGIHLLIPHEALPIKHAFMQFAVQDGRPIFAIPWKNVVLLGTTDTDYDGDLDQIHTDRSDVDYLLHSFNHYFPEARLSDDKILSAFAGLRPLVREENKSASKVSREHQIFEDPHNFFSIIGGKLTTYRVMAKDMVDMLSKKLSDGFGVNPANPKCTTHKVPLFGGDLGNYETFRKEWLSRLTTEHGFDPDIAEHFIENFGSRIPEVLHAVESLADGRERIHADLPFVWGELPYTVNQEMTLGLDDFMIRRTHLFSMDSRQGMDVFRGIAGRMQKLLGWSAEEKKAQIERYKFKIHLTQHFREKETE